jgi:hypothetical protein
MESESKVVYICIAAGIIHIPYLIMFFLSITKCATRDLWAQATVSVPVGGLRSAVKRLHTSFKEKRYMY